MITTFSASLLQKKQLTRDVFLFTFVLNEGVNFTYSAGQYVIVFVPLSDGTEARRLYSIASPPTDPRQFELLIQCVPHGIAGSYFLHSKEGDSMNFQGPAGVFTIKVATKPLVFLATGTGIAPIRSMLYSIPISQPISLFWGLKTIEDAYFLEEITQFITSHPSITFKLCLSRQKDMSALPSFINPYVKKGRITEFCIPSQFDQASQYYICGGKEIVESLRQFLEEKGIVKENIHFEKFT